MFKDNIEELFKNVLYLSQKISFKFNVLTCISNGMSNPKIMFLEDYHFR